MLKTLDKRFEAFAPERPGAMLVIEMVWVDFVNIFKLCCAPSILHGDGEERLRITEKVKENRRALRELFQLLLECYTRPELRKISSLQFNTEQDSRKAPKLPVFEPAVSVRETCFQRSQEKSHLCGRE